MYEHKKKSSRKSRKEADASKTNCEQDLTRLPPDVIAVFREGSDDKP